MENKIVRKTNFNESDILTYSIKDGKKILMDDTVYVTKVKPLINFSSSDSDRINSFVSNVKIAEISGIEVNLTENSMVVCDKIEQEIMGIVEKTTGEYILLATEACIYLMQDDSKLYISDEGVIFYVVSNRIAISLDGFLWEEYAFDELSPEDMNVDMEDEEIFLISKGIKYCLNFLFQLDDEHPVVPVVVKYGI